MRLIPETLSHWYARDGTPCFTVPKKNGDGFKDVTLREARQMGLLPSVTSILRVLAKPELEAWKLEQAILAALTLPRIEGEDLQQFAQRVVKDSRAQSDEAAQFGRKLHKHLESWLLGASLPADPDMEPFLHSVQEWFGAEVEQVYRCETVVTHSLGFAGTLDLHCRLRGIGNAVVDFKTQAVRARPAFYDEWLMQLAAYAACVLEMDGLAATPAAVSVVINSVEPGPVFCHQWPETEKAYRAFLCAFELWKFQKRYDPSVLPDEPQELA